MGQLLGFLYVWEELRLVSGVGRGIGPEMMGTCNLQLGRPPNFTPGSTLSRLKGSLRPRPHKMVADPDESPLFPGLLSLVCHPIYSFSLCSVLF